MKRCIIFLTIAGSLFLFAQGAAGSCTPVTNPVTGGTVDPTTWPTGGALPLTAPLGSPTLDVHFNWCAAADHKPSGHACIAAGFIQGFSDDGANCFLACDSISSPFAADGHNSAVTVTYGGCFTSLGHQGLTFEVHISCNANQKYFGGTSYSILGNVYSARLQSEHACGTGGNSDLPTPSSNSSTTNPEEEEPSGITGGGIFLMIIFIPFGIYLIGTIIFNAVKGKRGLELAPHPAFWKDVPLLVKEGIVFTFSKIRGCIQGKSARSGDYEGV